MRSVYAGDRLLRLANYLVALSASSVMACSPVESQQGSDGARLCRPSISYICGTKFVQAPILAQMPDDVRLKRTLLSSFAYLM